MPVLLCKDLKEKMKRNLGMSFGVISSSDFIRHIHVFPFLVDKSLMIAEFLRPRRAAPLNSSLDDATVFPASHSSSAGRIDDNRCPPEEVSPGKHLMTDKTGQPRALIVRPRRFGKSFCMSMIDDFLKMGDCKSSEHGRKLIFQQTEVWRKYPDFCEMHFAQHPVISASFKVCSILVCRYIKIKIPCSRT